MVYSSESGSFFSVSRILSGVGSAPGAGSFYYLGPWIFLLRIHGSISSLLVAPAPGTVVGSGSYRVGIGKPPDLDPENTGSPTPLDDTVHHLHPCKFLNTAAQESEWGGGNGGGGNGRKAKEGENNCTGAGQAAEQGRSGATPRRPQIPAVNFTFAILREFHTECATSPERVGEIFTGKFHPPSRQTIWRTLSPEIRRGSVCITYEASPIPPSHFGLFKCTLVPWATEAEMTAEQ